jgi:hypothetical protein
MTKAIFTWHTNAAKTPVKAAVDVFVVASLSKITLLGLVWFVSHSPKNPW